MNRESNEYRIDKEYWIDRLGVVHKFKGDLNEEIISMHSEIASLLYPESNRPTDILFNLGWIMIGSTVYYCPIINKKPSQAQINKLDKLDLLKLLSIKENEIYVNYLENQLNMKK